MAFHMPTRSPTDGPMLCCMLLAAVCGVAFAQHFVAATEPAAQHPASAQSFRIATLDLQRLVERHPLHQGLQEAIEEQIEFETQQAERQRKRAADALRRLRKAEEGTREHKRILAEIDRLQLVCDLNAAPGDRFDGTEVFRRILGDIHEVTARYCRQHGISLVLRRSASETDDEESPEVFEVVQRFVLYDAGHDITDDILRELQEQPAP